AASAGPGHGAEFTVRLPLAVAVAEAKPDEAPAADAPRLRILLVEDNRDSADSLKMLLELFGHEGATAYSGTAGVEAAGRVRPDVVLCDLGLPGMSGYAVAQALRADARTASARLIAVSGFGSEGDQRRCHEAGFEVHLTKPVDPDALQQV